MNRNLGLHFTEIVEQLNDKIRKDASGMVMFELEIHDQVVSEIEEYIEEINRDHEEHIAMLCNSKTLLLFQGHF